MDGPLSRGSGVRLNGGLSPNASVYVQGGRIELGHGSDDPNKRGYLSPSFRKHRTIKAAAAYSCSIARPSQQSVADKSTAKTRDESVYLVCACILFVYAHETKQTKPTK